MFTMTGKFALCILSLSLLTCIAKEIPSKEFLDGNDKSSLYSDDKTSFDSEGKYQLDSNVKKPLDSNSENYLFSEDKYFLDSNVKDSLDRNSENRLESEDKYSLDTDGEASLVNDNKNALDSDTDVLNKNSEYSLENDIDDALANHDGKISLDNKNKTLFDVDTESSLDGDSDTSSPVDDNTHIDNPDESGDDVDIVKDIDTMADNIPSNTVDPTEEAELLVGNKRQDSDETNEVYITDNEKSYDTVEIIQTDSINKQKDTPLDVRDVIDKEVEPGDLYRKDGSYGDSKISEKDRELMQSFLDDKGTETMQSLSQTVSDQDFENELSETHDNKNEVVESSNDGATFFNKENRLPMEDTDIDFDQLRQAMDEKDKQRENARTAESFEPIPMPTSFESYDINHDDAIDKEELIKVTGAWENVDVVFAIADTDGDKKISRTEFYKAPLDLSGKVSGD
ncbi:serine-aspartate repeat-containing protein F-like [Gigantopelta aegis]|uniref:serine-aspartate repeat-containing protein F-like n=1 Tax=Gigantopelta aegis TaxID=1735272 RepID=UPI001B88862F|nr:serine-aspartate repeat-containing protein F-like [Gigantopelta aegis]